MTLSEIRKAIDKAGSAKEFFGDEPDKRLKELLFELHPDRNVGDPVAEKLFKEVNGLYLQLKVAPPKLPVIQSPKKQRYELTKLLAAGDVADIYLSRDRQLVKISRVPEGKDMLKREQTALQELWKTAGKLVYGKYLPKLLDSFPANTRHVSVFDYNADAITLAKLKSSTNMLDPRHLGWIFNRLLTVLGFVGHVGYVHGSVLPEHILIVPETHGLVLVGWGQCVKSGEKITSICGSYKQWYPPEIFNKQEVGPATDIFMAAKCIQQFFHQDVPKQHVRFIEHCLLPGAKMRPSDAWKLLDEHHELMQKLYGLNFVKLKID